MAQIGVSDEVKAEIEKFAESRDVSMTEAANRLFHMAAGRLATLQRWAKKKSGEKVPAQVGSAPKKRGRPKKEAVAAGFAGTVEKKARAPRVRKAKSAQVQPQLGVEEEPRPV